ncbi:MAG: hypothetical protein COV98_00990 [Candidatus Altarchaeum sp. CG12_big_fil_rev_8_21_14_0_65_33_22]|uniref:CRISPR-associated helicase Cas3 n=1 Tax=Candidatus Altarchaeum hamiconexum TaxID=1803513 RepID=A0A8J7YSC7_9ARCH|nr:CRISPR-associated helicase Cas3' [Candidatus Altarchaeum hamiconexum]PIN67951.1 MAG: hypothetical protein COV98_00990 [Candidatus Altarchaeum sp. CG12_big_fil_rev_8_21_14_0_65_33_22]PIZ29310.1 MAG: hypothetical protein COY41_05945 [Candidatus Altarchaeum sp. CG_4_10_14_0_8_um_filter_32_851]PJC14640.1 MAG: hypothetical protein CO063_02505 [Candidatus Altarchaeum sp. CG_4_9_14_0_8_um_filter_32_206]NCN69086.1 CRISPR-associated helicase Cas3' [Candidatus Altarchaeum hamiconexum]
MENNPYVFSNFTEDELKLLKKCKAKTKPDESIYSHSYRCYNLSAKILEKFFISKSVIEYEKIKIELDIIKDICAFHVLLHDLGKSDSRFQDKIDGRTKSCPPHALLSLEKAKEKLIERTKNYDISEEQKKLLIYISLLSIASHHSDYHRDIYKKNEHEPAYQILKEIVNHLDELKYPNYYISPEIKFLYIFFNGVLRMSDWISSGNLEIKNLFFENHIELSKRIKLYLKLKNFSLYDHQKYFKTNFNCGFMRLPTGDGKTETALLANFPINKVIYTLPTVTTVESMRHRFEECFYKENVSFSHHLLFLSLYDEGRLNEEILHQYSMKKIVVTTIDKVLLSLMNYRHYPMLQMGLNNSYLIIDEIHSYSPYTLSLILNGLEYLKRYHNTKILVMSATLPKIIENELIKRIGAEELIDKKIVEERYKGKRKVNLRKDFIEEDIESNTKNILEMFKKGKKVLVVLNTVNKAKKIYEILKNENNLKWGDEIFLIHSRFNHDDKKEKNNFLEKLKQNKDKKGFVLIATQIVEVSLDIDFDVMFTEVSPFDSLVQRCGRVNRKGKKGACDVFLFSPERELPYKREQIEATKKILSNFKLETEMDFLTANDEYYNDIEDFYRKEFDKKPLEDFKGIERSNFGEELTRTRESFITLPVIPTGENNEIYTKVKEYVNILDNLSSYKKDKKLEINRFVLGNIVEVPIYVAKGDLKVKAVDQEIRDKFGVIFINATYNSETGIISKKQGGIIF